jgi:hypothetical protein
MSGAKETATQFAWLSLCFGLYPGGRKIIALRRTERINAELDPVGPHSCSTRPSRVRSTQQQLKGRSAFRGQPLMRAIPGSVLC